MLGLRGPPAYLLFHRGLTHSLLGILTLPPLLAAGLWWALGRRTSLAWLCLLCWAGAALHVLYDVVTPWGTMLLYPFSLERYALDWLFIVDLGTWVLPLAAVVAAWRRPDRSRAAALAYLITLAIYAGLSGAVHGAARRATAVAERDAGRMVAEAYAFPRPLSLWRWQGVAVTPVRSPEPRVTRYAVDGLPPGARAIERLDRGFDDPWVRRAISTPAGQEYLWWARVPVARVEASTPDRIEVTLSDLRFRRSIAPAAETWVSFSIRFEFDSMTGKLRTVQW